MGTKYLTYCPDDEQIHQGDIFKSTIYYESFKEKDGKFELSLLEFPFSIVLTQECDLNNNLRERISDKNKNNNLIKHDKYLVSLLCAPLYNAEHLFSGDHLEFLKIKTEYKNRNQKGYIKSNRDPRYHYIEFEDNIKLVPMVIDFKHYFTVTINYLESNIKNRVCSLKPIYREYVTQRFSNFLSRIGLPDPEPILKT